MAHHHHQGPARYNRAFAVGVALNVGYIAVEAGFGIVIGSLALLADAGHNLSDVLGLLLAWGGSYLSQRRPTRRFTSPVAAWWRCVLMLSMRVVTPMKRSSTT